MSITDKLNSILKIKRLLKAAINKKGGTITDQTPFKDYPTQVNLLSGTGGGSDTETLLRYLDGSLETFDDDRITYLDTMRFTRMESIKSIRLANLTKMGWNCFTECIALEHLELPRLEEMWYSIDYLPLVKELNLPKLKLLYHSVASNNYNLKILRIPNIIKIEESIRACYKLRAIIIEQTDSVCETDSYMLGRCYHFTGEVNEKYNPEGLKDGAIFVPDTLVESYKAAEHWSKFADLIKPLSEFREEDYLDE